MLRLPRLFVVLVALVFTTSCRLFFAPPPPPPPESPAAENTTDMEIEDDIILDDEGDPLESGGPIPATVTKLTGRKFRAATWNLHLWGPDKGGTHPAIAGGKPMDEAIFAMFKTLGFDIVALQEIYKPASNPTPPFPTTGGDYKVVHGDVVYTTSNGRAEYCPIAFRTTKFSDCTPSDTHWDANGRHVHWTTCTIKNTSPKKKIFYGCAHFFAVDAQTRGNIQGFFELIAGPAASADTPEVSATKADEFIFGLDANSYRYGFLEGTWEHQHDTWRQKNHIPANVDISLVRIQPANGFTKIYKRGGKIRLVKDAQKRIIDDLLWHDGTKITYVPNSKKISPVLALDAAHPPPAFWDRYYEISDHLPVQADFSY